MSSPHQLDTPKDLPPALPVSKILGPSFIILGLGLGSGEIILWPYLSSNFGLGMAWAILLGVTMQFFINMEVERYALIYGESIFVGFARWLKLLPLWFIVSTFLGFGWPGIGLAGATLVTHLFDLSSVKVTGIVIFLLIGLILTIGKQVYTTVETLQKYLISIGTPFIIILTFVLAKPADWTQLGRGLLGVGNGYNFLPENLAMSTFLGALAFAGAGGNLNLAQSFYVRDKGYGMGKFSQQIKNIFTNTSKSLDINLSGRTFPLTSGNLRRFRDWWHNVNLEHFLVFWLLGLTTMLTLSLLAYVSTQGHPDNPEGIKFVLTEAMFIGEKTLPFFSTFFLLTTGLMLCATQLTVLDSTSRIITENYLLIKGRKHAQVSRIYYLVLWLQILFGIIIIAANFSQPRELITLSAAFNGLAMFVYTALVLILNNRRLPAPLRPNIFRNTVLFVTFCFFGYFCFQTLFPL
jgi:hypothetical protein